MDWKNIESALEGILFAAGDSVPAERLCFALDLDRETLDAAARRLADFYCFDRRGIRLLKLADAYQLCSAPEQAEIIRKALEKRKPPRLSQAALEALAVVAYYQPVTRAYLEQVRGVDSSYTVNLLLDRGLIEPCGHLDAPGRPMQFRTTEQFLRSFGMTSLEDLPPLPSGEEETAEEAPEEEETR
ncbi:MAG: SMC-Scp complex subunit ScpB [Oscillospiraceae bacterium]|nr:SMC-Scp complex subunit ScpB [Oscillospiraceae bacterium]